MSTTTIALAIVGMFILALADFCIKQSAGKISPSLGTLVYAATAVAIPLVWTIWSSANGGLEVTREGILWSIGIGIAFSIFTGLMFLVFTAGVNLSIGTPVIRLGGIVIAATLGIVVFREGVNLQYILGFVLAFAGILLVVTR